MTYEESFQYTVDGDALLILFWGKKKEEKGGLGLDGTHQRDLVNF